MDDAVFSQMIRLVNKNELEAGLKMVVDNQPLIFFFIISGTFLAMVDRANQYSARAEKYKDMAEGQTGKARRESALNYRRNMIAFINIARRLKRLRDLVEEQMKIHGLGALLEGAADGGVHSGQSNMGGPGRIGGCFMGPVQAITSLN